MSQQTDITTLFEHLNNVWAKIIGIQQVSVPVTRDGLPLHVYYIRVNTEKSDIKSIPKVLNIEIVPQIEQPWPIDIHNGNAEFLIQQIDTILWQYLRLGATLWHTPFHTYADFLTASNEIAMRSLRGPGNVCIVPEKWKGRWEQTVITEYETSKQQLLDDLQRQIALQLTDKEYILETTNDANSPDVMAIDANVADLQKRVEELLAHQFDVVYFKVDVDDVMIGYKGASSFDASVLLGFNPETSIAMNDETGMLEFTIGLFKTPTHPMYWTYTTFGDE